VSFGSDLRAERESRGASLQEIAAGTKVSERHLLALESDAIADLPGGVFNKGFVRSYCHYLGLDQDAWARRYTDTFEAHKSEPDWAAFAENVRRNRAPSASTGLRWWGVVLMMLTVAALAFAVWHFLLHHRLPGR
jgi:cytoskeletal protein RodZ